MPFVWLNIVFNSHTANIRVFLGKTKNICKKTYTVVNIAQRANHPTSTLLPIDVRMQALVGKAQSAALTSRT